MTINVLVSGLPGNMASLAAQAVHFQSDMALVEHGLTGIDVSRWKGQNGAVIDLHKPTDQGVEDLLISLRDRYHPIIVDYTVDTAANANAELYCRLGIPFVIGTTGGVRERLKQTVLDSGNTAVIAPNMGKQIVALMGEISDFARQHEKGLERCKLYIRESHQGPDVDREFNGKADTSGTADAIRKDFNLMGIPYEKAEVNMIRMREDQLKLGIPKEFLDGHGWHTYWAYNKKGNDVLSELGQAMLTFLEQNPVFGDYTLVRENYSGHCCESGDILTPLSGFPEELFPCPMEEAEVEDFLVIEGAGAYCSGMSTKNYNSFPEASEVLLRQNGSTSLIRARQKREQIWQNEITPEDLR